MTELKESYCLVLDTLKITCLEMNKENDFKELFKGVIIMFIKDILLLYNKCLPNIDGLKTPKCAEKISNLNILLQSLETNGRILGFDCNDIIIRAYVNYFYYKYRDDLINWEIEKMKNIKEQEIKQLLLNSAKEEKIEDSASEYLNIIPEIVMIINCLREREIIKLFYLLNNLNIIMDVYLVKKSNNELK